MRRLFVWMLLGAAGCTTPIELDVPGGYEPRLAVDSKFTPDSLWSVRLSQSAPYSSDLVPPEAYLVTEAAVVVAGEDGFREELVHVGEGDFHSALGSRPAPEVRYTLTADAPGLPPVRASSIVPAVDAALIDIEEIVAPADYDPGAYVIRLNLHDAPGPHRYSVKIDMLDWVCYDERGFLSTSENTNSATWYRNLVLFTSDLPSMRDYVFQVADASEPFVPEQFYGEAYFSDDLFDGETLEIALEATSENPTVLPPHFRILLRSWSDALWRHEESVERYYLDEELFSERPVSVYSNVEDGLGVFGGWSQAAFYVDAEGNAWTEEDLKTGLPYARPCAEEMEEAEETDETG